MRRRLLALSVVSLLLFGTAACGGDSKGPGSSPSASVDMGQKIAGLHVSGAVGTAPTVTVDAPLKVDKPQSQVLKVGTGNPVQAGQEALLHIYLANGKDGKKAATTYDQGVPIDVKMDESSLFKAVVDALVGKPRGSRVAIAAPVKAIYGPQGASQIGLKPSDTVVFVVDVMSVPPKDVLSGPQGSKASVPSGIPGVETSGTKVTGLDFSKAAKKPGTKLQVIPLTQGTGPAARPQSLVTFNYFGEVYGAHKPFDESFSKQPVTFALGMNKLIQGWDKGLVGVKRGSRVMLIVPPNEGYGPQAQANIPANSTLVFVVDILGVDG
ncbi:MAG: FKBP-type peptidyl-prolyl cis-trans isomerase [Nocardioides sp.]